MIAGRQRTSAATAATARRAVTGRRRRHISAVIGAVDEGNVVLVEAERAAHKTVKAEDVAHQLDHARKFSVTHVSRTSPLLS